MKFILVLILLCHWWSAEGKCVFRGECYEVAGHLKPCAVESEATPIIEGLSNEEAEELIDILAQRCPTFVYDDDGNRKPNDQILTCCDPVSVRKFSESLMLAEGVLGRCPTCFRNFARQICELNCAADQDRFVFVKTEMASNGTVYVNEINYRVHEPFMIGAHASCAGVIVPQTGLPAINLMCGNAVVCDADAWFGFTGDMQNNPLAPVQVNFLRWPTEEDSMNVRAPECNETMEGDLPCSCMDCPATCPEGNEPIVPEICTVLNVNCIGFSIGLTFFVISVTIFTVLTLFEYRRMRINKPKIIQPPEITKFIKIFQHLFSKIGVFSATNPVLVIMVASWVILIMTYTALSINITSNPIELWSSPYSRSRQELDYFNTRFGPFYRAAQVYMRFSGLEPFQVDNVTYGPAYRIEAIRELIKLENSIINIGRETSGVTLEEVCYAPNRPRGSEKRLDQCVSMSISVYFGDDRDDINENTYLNVIQNCINNYFALNCLAPWGGGSQPDITFGGFSDDILTADTLLINFPLTNYLLEEDLHPVLEWEDEFLNLLHDYEANVKPGFVEIAFAAERSIEDEIRRVSVAEILPITSSYVIMFIYVTLALGNVKYRKTCLVDSKIIVAISSIFVVLCAIVCALGVMSLTDFTTTLLAINVIPFFILSVGIDNVFLMVNTIHDIENKLKEYEDYNENFSFEKKRRFVFEKMMRLVGPSMFVSSVTQITCFAIGSITKFPAVLTFAVFASLSLCFLFVFQITVVVSILSIDYKRAAQHRMDVFCCIQKKFLDDSDPLNSNRPYESVVKRLMVPYSNFIVNWRVKVVVAVIFMFAVSMSTVLIPQLEIGLDQEMALPTDSYVYRYLQAVNELLRLGPPVYFVLKAGLNFSDPDHQNVVCGGQLCYDDSLTTQIFLAAQHTNITYISQSSNSWLDDFTDWSGLSEACCKYNITDNSFCPSADTSLECAFCSITRNEWANGLRPSKEAFERYIPFFLRDEPTQTCNKGGLASYSGAVNYILDLEGRATVHDTNFMAYHSPLSNSLDYITALKYGYEISANISTAIKKHTDLDIEVFPYSVFYVFYEQYLTMWKDTFKSLGYCLLGALGINLIASGFNFLTTFAVIFTCILVLINMMGVMYIWNIPLNAVSCVNLIVSIGIAVEFCGHIAYAFATSKRPSDEKVQDALQQVGSTVITGITFTNIPIIVLALSYTQIIEVFFFRMFFSLVILGFLHGMVFFPVLLSYLNNLKNK